jgi:hypothetical protein
MALTASQLHSASHPKTSAKVLEVLGSILDSVSLVLFPSLLALLISAVLVGHGEISSKSILDVLNMMAQTTATMITAP